MCLSDSVLLGIEKRFDISSVQVCEATGGVTLDKELFFWQGEMFL